MGTPVIFGANNTTTGLQNAFLMANGANFNSNGPKNYITYGNFENNLTTGWSLGTIGTLTNSLPTGTPTFGSGASANLTISTVSSGQIAGNYSLSLASAAASTAGNMLASQAYTLETADQAKALTFQFYYSTPTNPSNVNFSGTSSNSWALAVYDVTNSVWLPVNGAFGLTQSTGVGLASCVFQTGSSTASIRVCIYAANATAGSSTMYLDRFYLGPQQVQYGSFMSDWQSYTVNITGSTSNPTKGTTTRDTGWWRREGDSIRLRYEYVQTVAGSAGSGRYIFSLPSGLTIDSTKLLVSNGTAGQSLGSAIVYDGTNANYGVVQACSDSSSAFEISYGTAANRVGSTLAPLSNLVNYGVEAIIPISGWSSNQILSSDSSQNVVALIADTSTTAATANTTNINFTNVLKDTNAAYSSGVYTCPVSGYYWIFGETYTAGAHTAFVYVNAVSVAQGTPAASASQGSSVSVLRFLNANDTVAIRIDATQTLSGGAVLNRFNIFRVSGPAQLAQAESVAFCAASTTTAASTTQPFIFTSVDFDTTNSYSTSTGKWTCPLAGTYAFQAQAYSSNAFTVYFYKNGSIYAQGMSIASASIPSGAYILMKCVPGDTVDVRPDSNQTGVAGTNRLNKFCGFRVGN